MSLTVLIWVVSCPTLRDELVTLLGERAVSDILCKARRGVATEAGCVLLNANPGHALIMRLESCFRAVVVRADNRRT